MENTMCGARADFQTAGLNGVFAHFCRRGQKWVAPERETSPCRLLKEMGPPEAGKGSAPRRGRGTAILSPQTTKKELPRASAQNSSQRRRGVRLHTGEKRERPHRLIHQQLHAAYHRQPPGRRGGQQRRLPRLIHQIVHHRVLRQRLQNLFCGNAFLALRARWQQHLNVELTSFSERCRFYSEM